MGVIRVMQTRKDNTNITDTDEQRREGMRSLGALLIAMTATTPAQHGQQLAAAIKSLIDSSGANLFQVFYDPGARRDPIRLTDAVQAGRRSPNVRCTHRASGAPVMLMSRIDTDNGRSRQMDVVFPQSTRRYLRRRAKRIRIEDSQQKGSSICSFSSSPL